MVAGSDGQAVLPDLTGEVGARDCNGPVTSPGARGGDGGGNRAAPSDVDGAGRGGQSDQLLATVEVVAPLAVITQAPASTTNELCGTVGLTVVAVAPVPLAYQWYQFGTNAVAGGTNAT